MRYIPDCGFYLPCQYSFMYSIRIKGVCKPLFYMESGKKMLTFVEVIETDNAGFTINEKKIADYKTGVVTQGQSATID